MGSTPVVKDSVGIALLSVIPFIFPTLARGECFGRITIEAMAFKLPVLDTAAGGTTEIVLDGSTGLLHPAGKEGVAPLAKNNVRLASHAEQRASMGKNGRVKERFMEHHMAERIAAVLKEVLQKSWEHSFLSFAMPRRDENGTNIFHPLDYLRLAK
ncbi:uncharacterized protein LOC133910291 [Phragmites australis]|uniref:uncharacterized protein LOC133910291 n=1 Tax=Phragmites australis TaxID=29695 RepID=UPI002D79BD72|nr:uncharacterized protein LOC133910291 [Phragmites australis]